MSMADILRTRMAMVQPGGAGAFAQGLSGGVQQGVARAIQQAQFQRQMDLDEKRAKAAQALMEAQQRQMDESSAQRQAEEKDVVGAYNSMGGTVPTGFMSGGMPGLGVPQTWSPTTARGAQAGMQYRDKLAAMRERADPKSLQNLMAQAGLSEAQARAKLMQGRATAEGPMGRAASLLGDVVKGMVPNQGQQIEIAKLRMKERERREGAPQREANLEKTRAEAARINKQLREQDVDIRISEDEYERAIDQLKNGEWLVPEGGEMVMKSWGTMSAGQRADAIARITVEARDAMKRRLQEAMGGAQQPVGGQPQSPADFPSPDEFSNMSQDEQDSFLGNLTPEQFDDFEQHMGR